MGLEVEVYRETPGGRIRAERDRLGISQDELAKVADITERAIMSLEANTLLVGAIGAEKLGKIAARLGITRDHILYGEPHSVRATREEMRRMREEGRFRSNEEFSGLDELAFVTIRKRSNANIPLSRAELIALLEVIRGADGY